LYDFLVDYEKVTTDKKYLLCGYLTQNGWIGLLQIYTGSDNEVFAVIKYFFCSLKENSHRTA
jgi:hypothetical protein